MLDEANWPVYVAVPSETVSLTSRVLGRYLRLPAPTTRAVRVRRDLPVRARDGVVLRTDHYEPRLLPAPTILIRSPYGRRGVMGLVSGRTLAEHGFHVVLQSCRGTFDSGGVFDPMRYEREDGLDTVAWIEAQPWFDGNLFTYGPSYLGFTQWAIAAEAGPALKGMLASVTTAGFRDPTYAGGAYSLHTIVSWATLLSNQGGSLASYLYKQARSQRRIRRALVHFPLSEVDTRAIGDSVPFFQEWLAHSEPDDPYWTERVYLHQVPRVEAPVCLLGGWYDIFLPWQLRDYAALRAAGRSPRLVIGPWTHADPRLLRYQMSEGLTWFRRQLNGECGEPGGVRIHVGGADEWRDLPEWPPRTGSTEWFLRAGGGLTPDTPETPETLETPADAPAGNALVPGSPDDGGPDKFRYDPADPTPSPGGPLLTPQAGRRDNRAVEARSDVLVYTSEPLRAAYEAIGPVSATVHIRSSLAYFDVHVRVCEVDGAGRSWNLCDGLVRVHPGLFPPGADRVRAVEVELWPMAYRFPAGHRIRVQVAGGAHPRYARNPGTGESLATASRLFVADNEVFHDPVHPSVLRLPG